MVKMAAWERLVSCCCGGEGRDESDIPYRPLNDSHSSVAVVRPRNVDHTHFREISSDLHDASPAPQASLNGSTTDMAPRSKREQEEDALNAIIDRTQLNIIDVSHLENVEMPSGELVARQRKYEEAVRNHDARASRNGVVQTAKVPGSTCGLSGHLLEDTGARVSDWLGRPPLARGRIVAAEEAAQRISSALAHSLTVTSSKPLIVYMDK